jgi:hypothetical protein
VKSPLRHDGSVTRLHPRSAEHKQARKKQIPMCSLRSLICLHSEILPRQWKVGPSSDSRPTKQRRESEANGPEGQRPATVSRRGPSWTEFVRLADQAAVAIGGAGMMNRAEPRACGHSRGSRRLDSEPEIPIQNRDRSCVKRSRARLRKRAGRPGWLPAVLGKTRRTE